MVYGRDIGPVPNLPGSFSTSATDPSSNPPPDVTMWRGFAREEATRLPGFSAESPGAGINAVQFREETISRSWRSSRIRAPEDRYYVTFMPF